MENDALMTVGQFAAASGLTVNALRHYHSEQVLIPAEIDDRSRYRRYRPDQLSTARLIGYLRSAELPVGEIRRIVREEEPNPAAVLRDHRRRLASERKELRARMRRINRLIEDVTVIMSEGLLDREAVDLLTPMHYLFEQEVWLETTHMTIDDAVAAEQLLCALYDIEWVQFTFEEETRSEWTIFTRRGSTVSC